MLTIEKFDNWLYDMEAAATIALSHGTAPEKIAEKNPEFAKVYARLKHWCDVGFVQIDREGERWLVQSRIVPKRYTNNKKETTK